MDTLVTHEPDLGLSLGIRNLLRGRAGSLVPGVDRQLLQDARAVDDAVECLGGAEQVLGAVFVPRAAADQTKAAPVADQLERLAERYLTP